MLVYGRVVKMAQDHGRLILSDKIKRIAIVAVDINPEGAIIVFPRRSLEETEIVMCGVCRDVITGVMNRAPFAI